MPPLISNDLRITVKLYNKTKQMKTLIFLFLIAYSCSVAAQKSVFIRVYNLAGYKIMKGKFAGTTDSAVLIYKDTGIVAISFTSIGYIKTKRSLGHNMAICAVVGAVPLAIAGAAEGEPAVNDGTLEGDLHDALNPTPAEGGVSGLFVGGVLGAATGAAITAFTKHTIFTINGNLNNWYEQKKKLDLMPAGK